MKNIKKTISAMISATYTAEDNAYEEYEKTEYFCGYADATYIRCDNRTIRRLADALDEVDISFCFCGYPMVNLKATYKLWVSLDERGGQFHWGLERVSYVVETEKAKAEVLTTQKRKRRRA